MELLADVLDKFGADRTRWPAAARREISALLTVSAEARRQLSEAEAFDRLLDKVPGVDAGKVAALADKIMAASRTTPRVAATRTPPPPRAMPVLRRRTAGFAALAASLMIGILAGQSASVQPTVSDLADYVGLSGNGGGLIATAPRLDESDASVDEELL